MKMQRAKCVLNQHKAAVDGLDSRRRELAQAEQRVKDLGIESVRAESTIKDEEDAIIGLDRTIEFLERQLKQKRDMRASCVASIARLRHQLSKEPIELRTARQMVVQCKERIVAQERKVTKWSEELAEAQKVVDEVKQRDALRRASEEATAQQVRERAKQELIESGQVPEGVDIDALVEKHLTTDVIFKRRNSTSIAQQFLAR